jgi:hypothetical protein
MVIGVAVAVVVGLFAATVWDRDDGTTRLGRDDVVVARGDAVTPAVGARPAPATTVAPVRAPGACGAAMDALRSLQRRYASGAVLPPAANATLTARLARLHRACAKTPQFEDAFRTGELTPWLTYLPPGVAAG